jgi:hypothetical protein
MATRLGIKRKKMARDKKAAHLKDPKPQSHKIARKRSTTAKLKKLNRSK